jgi:caa(3)-type oxidase subunit IV
MEEDQEILVSRVAEQHRHHGKAQFFYVWVALLIMTGIEVYLAYQTGVGGMLYDQPFRMLSMLMGLSLLKAGLIIAYFMHLKYEVSPMKWMTMSSLVICLCLMLIFLPDAYRILRLGVPQ